jgi:hypothetical protein
VEFLREAKWKLPELTADGLVALCNARSCRLLFYFNGLQQVRYQFNDYDRQKDWFRPFVRAMLIWHEDMRRADMGLPSLLPDELPGLKYCDFMNLVVDGAANPYYEWEKRWAQATT